MSLAPLAQRRSGRKTEVPPRWRSFFSFLALLLPLALGLQPSCDRGNKWNVLLLTLDTTRADHLRCYGNDRVETPALNELANRGVLFENAYSHIPLTLPAHTSMLTGTVPLYHGVEDNGAYMVPDDMVTLAEILKDHGYRTAAFVSAAVLKKTFNLDQGFDEWNEEGIEPQKEESALVAERKGDKTTDAALEWLGKKKKNRFFLWIHYYDPHAAYEPPEPFKTLYPDPYLGEIAFMDSQIKRVLNKLEELGLLDRTLIVAIGDHGEGLGEHGESTHSTFIYNATQHVPWLMTWPGNEKSRGKRIKTVVSLADLMPTVLAFLGLPSPAAVTGKNLRELLEGGEDASPEQYAFLESKAAFLHWGWSPLFGIATQKWKYIKAPTPELYDLEHDPRELHNLAEEQPKIARQLAARLEEMIKEFSREQKVRQEAIISPRLKSQLEALGYNVGGFQAKMELAQKKDPKDYTDLIPVLINAHRHRVNSDYIKMLELAEIVLKRDPENPLALQFLGDSQLGFARYAESIAAYQKYLEIHGPNILIYIKLGTVYLRLRNLAIDAKDKAQVETHTQSAVSAFQACLAIQPHNPIAHYYLGRIALEDGDLDKAASQFRASGVADTEYGHVGMALLYDRQGNLALAEAEFQRAEELSGEKSVLFWQEWSIFLIRHGRAKDALAYLNKAMENDPSLKNEKIVLQALEIATAAEKAAGPSTPENSPSSTAGDSVKTEK